MAQNTTNFYDARPLLSVPGYEVPTPYGPVRVSHTRGPSHPVLTVVNMDQMLASKPDSISAWLVSTVEPTPPARHFEQASITVDQCYHA
jgi:hypothetical protein